MTPQDGARRVTGRVPLGASNASWTFVAYIDDQRRLVDDWPGFPGTVSYTHLTLPTSDLV